MTELPVCLCRQQFFRLFPLLHGKIISGTEILIIFYAIFLKKDLFYLKRPISPEIYVSSISLFLISFL